jgi:FkbM family methyltransferase
VSDKKGTADFITVTQGFTQMSGLSKTYDDQMLKRIRSDPRHAENVVKVPTRSLSAILVEAGIMHPDFVSLDIEGGELAALQKFPFDKHDVTIWSIENNNADPALPALMREKGYNLAEFCGPDEIYVKMQK